MLFFFSVFSTQKEVWFRDFSQRKPDIIGHAREVFLHPLALLCPRITKSTCLLLLLNLPVKIKNSKLKILGNVDFQYEDLNIKLKSKNMGVMEAYELMLKICYIRA
uniref:Uncharacterized protein n=1 Tax=Lactuca sativa TaxID=4236 RepID=A0A9R1XSW3_LACSA|nr:hypothetical protein LSAT_V11C100037880 [Lactuca sativa]